MFGSSVATCLRHVPCDPSSAIVVLHSKTTSSPSFQAIQQLQMTKNDTPQILTEDINSTRLSIATTSRPDQVQTTLCTSKEKDGRINVSNTFAEFILKNLRLVTMLRKGYIYIYIYK